MNDQCDVLQRLEVAAGDADQVEGFAAVDLQGLDGVVALELAGQHTHADEVGAVDTLVTARHDNFDAQHLRALGRPVARRAGAVGFAAKDEQRHAVFLVLHRRFVNSRLRAIRLVKCDAAFAARDHQVLDARVGEGAADHDFMVGAA